MDPLDSKLLEAFSGKVVRKDLLHRIKKGTNVPTFVLEFLLARYCASDEPTEIQAGLEAVLATLQDNYVRADEANTAQSKVATKGKHKFIDKVHVKYVEKEKRHWAALENFNSQRIAIADKFYRNNDRLLEGGIWAEVTLAYNEIEDDDYAFYIEELRPIQLTRFDFDQYAEGRRKFTRDEWMDAILRSVGLEPGKLTQRRKMHFILRLAPLAEPNFNFIELGPRSTGKSYFFSEFSPYSTLISGGQATKTVLFYNNARKRIGLVGFWDTVAFDEVAGIRIKDPDTIQIMKDYLANGRFSRGVEVIADASMVFVGNIDHSIEQIVNSPRFDLFMPLPKEFDLAVMDRFASYLPGWEMPKNSSEFLTDRYGFITDYLCEAFHYQFSRTNRYEEVSKRIRLGESVEGRDEKGIKKTVCAFLKILHPDGPPSDSEFEEYVAYAVECRRRVKEQMNKRKPDDEFAKINLSYFTAAGNEIVVFCPESKSATATQQPQRTTLSLTIDDVSRGNEILMPEEVVEEAPARPSVSGLIAALTPTAALEQHFTIYYGDTGHSYESLITPYLQDATAVLVESPHIHASHQVQNFVRFCEAVVKQSAVRRIQLITSYDDSTQLTEVEGKWAELKQSLLEIDVELDVQINEKLHDREIRIDNGWTIRIGRGLDFYQTPTGCFEIGVHDLSLRKCLETKVDIFRLSGSSPDMAPIESFHSYDLLKRFDAGGMAEAYLARNRDRGEIVFLKRVRGKSGSDKDAIEREARIYERLMRMHTNHILQVLDFIRDNEYVVLVTQYAEGGDLSAHVERSGGGRGLSVGEAKDIGISIATALKELHDHDIVHRDLKPQNVLSFQNEWKLADFGISKNRGRLVTQKTFQQFGTHGYAAPEQFQGVEAHPSADIYSLGKLLVFLLTGQTDVDRVAFTSWRDLILRCIRSDPSERPPINNVIAELELLPS